MMSATNEVSAAGERAAMGGYIPQFSEFAWLAYRELANNRLAWIRIADPEAQKLDDIQYATCGEVHAYQVKWTIAEDKISFNDFKNLIPSLVSSWQGLRVEHRLQQKEVFAHLLTNKILSAHDRIECEGGQSGSFNAFFNDVWRKIKAHQSYDPKWQLSIDELTAKSGVSEDEFADFIDHFDFHPAHIPEEFSVNRAIYQQRDDDLEKLRSYILESVSSSSRPVEISASQIISDLHWGARFKTTFNHELVVDPRKYQPITSTLRALDSKMDEHSGGYLFLSGAPGSGKSTLLTEWARTRQVHERVVRYYAFNFSNPTSSENHHERGESISLFFDLIFQLKEKGILRDPIVPYRNLHYLRRVFYEQIELLGQDYVRSGQKTILLIDGLDHVPREYQRALNSFIHELPLPAQLPDGVYIILGSQSYELEDLTIEIKSEWQRKNRTVSIDPLSREAILQYIDASSLHVSLTSDQILTLTERSQGHPLYLSYLLESLRNSDDIESTIDTITPIEGNIDIYYRKIWQPIEGDQSLTLILGLMARINGPISLDFIREWHFLNTLFIVLRKKAKSLFIDSTTHWSFFHNSFRQFLLHHTALDGLTGDYSGVTNSELHRKLAAYYESSTTEPHWLASFHLYQAGDYSRFLQLATPAIFVDQLIHFRPDQEIMKDIRLGLELASQTQDVVVLTRYALALSELQGRLSYIEPALFVKEFLQMNKPELTRRYLRTGNTLQTNQAFALNAAREFIDYGDSPEAALLFTLSEPSTIKANNIIIDESLRFDEAKNILEKWVVMALHFRELPQIFILLNNIQVNNDEKYRLQNENSAQLRLVLMQQLAYRAISLQMWTTVDAVLKEIDNAEYRDWTLHILQEAIEEGLANGKKDKASEYLDKLLELFSPATLDDTSRIYVADLIYGVKKDVPLVLTWLNQVPQPSGLGKKITGLDNFYDEFYPFITLNKLLSICGESVSIEMAVPDAVAGKGDELSVSFLRIIALITQILADCLAGKPTNAKLIEQIQPAVQFYYRNPAYLYHPNPAYFDSDWYPLTRISKDYFNFLVVVIRRLGLLELNKLGDYFLEEFDRFANHWAPDAKRNIIVDLVKNGYESAKVKPLLIDLESTMLDGKDVDGRVTECRAQTQAWLTVKDFSKAEHWLQLSLHEAAGVGYRKDYQLNEWLRWLQEVNIRQPDQAPDRIRWFLARLLHVRHVTEGPAFRSLSEVLLETTLLWNFDAGREQLQWQLLHNFIDLDDALHVFIISYLSFTVNTQEYETILDFYISFFLSHCKDPNHYTIRKLIDCGFAIFGEQLIDLHIPNIIESINKLLEEKGEDLLKTIEELVDKYKLTLPDNKLSSSASVSTAEENFNKHRNMLSLRIDHRQITEEEVLASVNNYEELISFLDQEDVANSSFSWLKVIETLSPALDSQQIRALAEYERKSLFYSLLSKLAWQIDDVALAQQLAEKALYTSSEFGWSKGYDGGSRLQAFEAMITIAPVQAKQQAFDVFKQDLISSNHAMTYVLELRTILPLLNEEFTVEQIWTELSDYLNRLFANSNPLTNLPELEPSSKGIIESLADLKVWLSDNYYGSLN